MIDFIFNLIPSVLWHSFRKKEDCNIAFWIVDYDFDGSGQTTRYCTLNLNIPLTMPMHIVSHMIGAIARDQLGVSGFVWIDYISLLDSNKIIYRAEA